MQAFGVACLGYGQNCIDKMARRLRQKIATRRGLKLPLKTERVRGFPSGDEPIIAP